MADAAAASPARWLSVALPVLLACAGLGSGGCESGPPKDDAAVALVDAGATEADLAGVVGTVCSAISCAPPFCCNAICPVAGCCPGTICGANGRCIPRSCAACGELGCIIDQNACAGTCARPTCCLQICNVDGDCCAATRCRPDIYGTRHCTPDSCNACAGLHPVCDVTVACDVTCRAPATCGQACVSDAICGRDNVCRTFLDGQKLCVPSVFEATCNACGPRGCLFHAATCTIDCRPPDVPDLGTTDDAAVEDMAVPPVMDAAMAPDLVAGTDDAGTGDAGTGDDGGVIDASVPPDLRVSPDLAHVASGPCKGCCGACINDNDCCPGNTCQPDAKGHMICAPAQCLQCAYGCKFTCP